MFPVMTTEGGQCMAFPDVCLTQTGPIQVPIPYPNIAMCSDGKGSEHVTIRNAAIMRKGDSISTSSGDEPALQGVISGKKKGKAEVQLGWSGVKVEGKEVGYLTSMTAQNGASPWNIPPGLHAVPSQTQVTVQKMMQFANLVLVHAEQFLPCSPMLREQLKTLENQGWKFVVEERTGGGCVRETKTIKIPKDWVDKPHMLLMALSHEAGHALYKRPKEAMPGFFQKLGLSKKMTGKEFVDKELVEDAQDEGMAVLNNCRVAAQVNHRCPNLDPNRPPQDQVLIPSSQGWSEDYKKMATGPGTDQEKAKKIGDIFMNERRSSGETYREVYRSENYNKMAYFQKQMKCFVPPWK